MTHRANLIIFLIVNFLLFASFLFCASSEQYSPDIYENDDRHGYKSAQVIVIDDSKPQHHNFHKAGDVDWVKFYGLADMFYSVEVVDPGSKCNPIIELYDSDGTTLLWEEFNCPIVGQKSLSYKFLKEGFYYVKLSNCDSNAYGTDTEYDLKVFIPKILSPPPLPGILTGIISDSITKAPIRNAVVKTNHMGSSLSNAKGSYTLIEEQGNWALTVDAVGYRPFSQNVSIVLDPQTFNVEMTPIGSVNEAEEGISEKISYGSAFSGITYSTHLFAAAGNYGTLATSTDGKSWTDRSFSTDNELYGIAYGNHTYVSVGDYGTILYSTDAILWTKTTSNTENHLYGITYGDGLFIAVGESGTILISPGENIWTDWSSDTSSALYGITYANSLFVAVGDKGKILTSPDGNIWTDRSFSTNNALYGVTYGNGVFVAVGEYGMILTSSDGAEWTDRSVNPCYELYAIAYGNGTFIAGGDSGKLLSSNDGVTWRERKSNTETGLYGIAYGNGAFVAVGDSEGVLLSEASIKLQSPLDGTSFDACSLSSPPTFSWYGEGFKGYEVQFSSDTSFNSIPVKVKVSATQPVLSSAMWKKVLTIQGLSGGTVYWRVMGRRADGSMVFSGVRSFGVEATGAVGNPAISSTSKSSFPTLSWQNNCGVKFKAWFGSDEIFTKKVSYAFSVKNLNDNGGLFSKGLTSAQWKAIRKLVNDLTGSTIYWYVESWDGLNRYSKTEPMNFTLTN